MSFPFSVSQLCYLYVCSIISLQRLQIRSTPPEDHSRREAHSTFSYSTLCTFTPLFCFVLFCFVLFCFALFPIQGLCQFGSRSPSPRQNMSHKTEHVGHWEDLETWLSVATVSLLPKAAETLKHQTQDQLDDNITSLMDKTQVKATVTKNYESFQEELKHAYELRYEPSRTGHAPTAPLPSRTGSPVPGLTREQKTEGVVIKHSP